MWYDGSYHGAVDEIERDMKRWTLRKWFLWSGFVNCWFTWETAVSAVTGGGKIIDEIEETEGEGLSTCVSEDEINEGTHPSVWIEDITDETYELLVESGSERNKFDGASSNGFGSRVKLNYHLPNHHYVPSC